MANIEQIWEKIDPQRLQDLAMSFLEIASPTGNELEFTEHYAGCLTEAGLDVKLTREYPNSPNVVARHRFGDGRTLQFDGHTDTIHNPHDSPHVADGVIYGRGACDMKGQLACMAETARILIKSGVEVNGSILLTAHGMHEAPVGLNETLDVLIKNGDVGDAVVVGECAHDTLPLEGSGMSIFEITVTRAGEVMHETKARGVANPIWVGNEILNRLRQKAGELALDMSSGVRPSLFVGEFSCGDFYNRVPVECKIVGTRRYSHTSNSDEVVDELNGILSKVNLPKDVDIKLKVTRAADGFKIFSKERLVQSLHRSYNLATGQDLPEGTTQICGNLPWFVRDAEIPAVYHGANQDTAHADVECVTVDELVRLTKVYTALVLDYLS